MKLTNLARFARDNWLPSTVLAIALVAFVWFSARIVLNFVYFNDPRHQDQALKAWMTPRYVAMSYDLPRPVVAEILELDMTAMKRPRMADIAREQGVTLQELNERVRAAAKAYRDGGS